MKTNVELSEVVDSVEVAINPYETFSISVSFDAFESEHDPENTHGLLTVKDEHRDGDIAQTYPLRWRADENDYLDVEFRVGEETWTPVDELPLSMYFHAVDLWRALRYKEAARLAAKE